jgi:hypothetical protein
MAHRKTAALPLVAALSCLALLAGCASPTDDASESSGAAQSQEGLPAVPTGELSCAARYETAALKVAVDGTSLATVTGTATSHEGYACEPGKRTADAAQFVARVLRVERVSASSVRLVVQGLAQVTTTETITQDAATCEAMTSVSKVAAVKNVMLSTIEVGYEEVDGKVISGSVIVPGVTDVSCTTGTIEGLADLVKAANARAR